jgi:hypothetical protein
LARKKRFQVILTCLLTLGLTLSSRALVSEVIEKCSSSCVKPLSTL